MPSFTHVISSKTLISTFITSFRVRGSRDTASKQERSLTSEKTLRNDQAWQKQMPKDKRSIVSEKKKSYHNPKKCCHKCGEWWQTKKIDGVQWCALCYKDWRDVLEAINRHNAETLEEQWNIKFMQ